MRSIVAPGPLRMPEERIVLLAPLLRSRAVAATVFLVGAGYFGANAWFDVPLGCPVREFLQVRCPGCGLTEAIEQLFRGEWARSLATHAFAPLFVGAMLLVGVAACLPGAVRGAMAAGVARWEARSGFGWLFLSGLLIYGLLRRS